MKFTLIKVFLILLLVSCNQEVNSADMLLYQVNGRVIDNFGVGIKGVKINYNTNQSTITNAQGYWEISNLFEETTITSSVADYTFFPSEIIVNNTADNLMFKGSRIPTESEEQIFNWFNNQQLPNGLLESAENSNYVSLYDNALAAMVFMLKDDFERAENIFDFFNARITTELTNGVGGFSQIRNSNGIPNNRRWMGDNAWLLIALNNYKNRTGFTTYDNLALELSNWLQSLQDTDGGLFAGYYPSNNLIDFKVTEGNIDAFNAVEGFTTFHSELLNFLKNDRWDTLDKNLISWPTNPLYINALDLHSWSYSIFKNYPISAQTTADRFLTTQVATNGLTITGYCFDEDKDTVWLEGTGQMALAFGISEMQNEKNFYLNEMDKVIIESSLYSNSKGFPYASNPGTSYGSDLLWTTADSEIAISGGAWYLFAKYNFNPFAIGREKNIPENEMFWIY
ncbi:hypothetical protein [Lutibacter sp.]|uniref:hypothetical protein n=1 Tax=Lutibacter sp. TaxID=1925666 RepID=UPI003563C748